MLELSKSVRLFVTLHACFFVISCNEHSENEIGHEAKTNGFTNKMAIGEEAVEASLKEFFELRETYSDCDLSKEKSMINDMGGHLAYRRFLGSATPTEISDKYAEYGMVYHTTINSASESGN